MLAVNRVTRAELEEQARKQYMQALGPSRDGPSEPPRIVNAREAAGIDRPVPMAYRGRLYMVRPISYADGCTLQALIQELALHGRDAAASKRILGEMVALFQKLAVPRSGWRRWLRLALPNPFRGATVREIAGLLDFFWTCLTGQSLAVLADAGTVRQKSTSRTTSTPSGSPTKSGP